MPDEPDKKRTDVLVLLWSEMECFKKCEFGGAIARYDAALTIADTLVVDTGSLRR